MDFHFALRNLRKTPGFTLLAIFVMAMGIGANTAMFSVVNTVLLKPLAYRDPDRIVTVRNRWTLSGENLETKASVSAFVSTPDFHDWHDRNTVFSAIAYYKSEQTAVLAQSVTEYALVTRATPEFLDVFGISPAAGRWFDARETKPASAGAAVISDAYWRAHFAADPKAIGRVIRIYEKPVAIVGVLPAGFDFPDQTEIWIPANTLRPETTSRGGHNYFAIARLKPGVSVPQAQAQMDSIAAALSRQFPDSNRGKGILVERLSETMTGDVRTTLYLLLGAVGIVLLIACANLANLLLARSVGRRKEIAIRAAMGANRSRIVRQLMAESGVLVIASGAAGLLAAVWGKDAMVAIAPADIPRLSETSIDLRVLAFTFAISILSILLFGLIPAFSAARVDLNEALKRSSSRGSIGGVGAMRNALVAAEIALAVILLAGAGLLGKSLVAIESVNLGFHPDHLLVMKSSVPSSDLDSARRATRFYKTLLGEISSMPGVAAAGATMDLPGDANSNGGYWVDHLPQQMSVNAPQAVYSVIAPGTLRTIGVGMKAGRDFNSADTFDAPFVAIINESLARKAFPGENPVGHVIFCGMDTFKGMTIVGVAGDVRQYGPETAPSPEIFMNYEQHPLPSTSLKVLVRTAGDPAALIDALRGAVRGLSGEVPVKFSTVDASLSERVAAPRFRTLLLAIFAALAVCLAMAGVYGVTAYMASERSSEVALRMALGAQRSAVLKLVLAQGAKLAAIGIAAGLAGALAVTRLLDSMLFDVRPNDPLTYVAVALLAALIALAASYIPARRATKIDPLAALRQE